MLVEGLHMRQKFPVIDMQKSLIVAYKHPLILDHFTFGQFRSFVDMPNFFSQTAQRSITIDMIRRMVLAHMIESK